VMAILVKNDMCSLKPLRISADGPFLIELLKIMAKECPILKTLRDFRLRPSVLGRPEEFYVHLPPFPFMNSLHSDVGFVLSPLNRLRTLQATFAFTEGCITNYSVVFIATAGNAGMGFQEVWPSRVNLESRLLFGYDIRRYPSGQVLEFVRLGL